MRLATNGAFAVLVTLWLGAIRDASCFHQPLGSRRTLVRKDRSSSSSSSGSSNNRINDQPLVGNAGFDFDFDLGFDLEERVVGYCPSCRGRSSRVVLRGTNTKDEDSDMDAEADADAETETEADKHADGSIPVALGLAVVAGLYWYLLVFGAAAAASGLPVPEGLPLIPGWPPSDADLAPALEDSAHFLYLPELLGTTTTTTTTTMNEPPLELSQPPAVRLAVFNAAEAWIFAILPVLLADRRRLPLPVLLFAWLGALGLTNAFLVPYLAVREAFAAMSAEEALTTGTATASASATNSEGSSVSSSSSSPGNRNAVLSIGFGAILVAVLGYAVVSSMGDFVDGGGFGGGFADFAQLATEDRTYLAFCVDLVLFSVWQPFLLHKVRNSGGGGGGGDQNNKDDDGMPAIYRIPFVGLAAWLFGV